MPQMAPMNWTFLYFIFLSMYLFTVILNFYIFLYTPKMKLNSKNYKINKNWKW